MRDYGWLRDATIDQLQPLVEAATKEIETPSGSAVARKAVSYVMQAFRTPDLANPAVFVDMAVGALEEFPALVLAELASPKTGIVRDSKFPPSIAEMVQWCEARMKEHRARLDTGRGYLCNRIAARDAAQLKIEQAEQRAKDEAEWLAGEPERQRKAKEAEMAVAAAAAKRAVEEAKRRKEQEARAAWMKRIFSQFVDDAVITERLCSLSEADQDEATRRELEMPGAGSQWLAAKVQA